MLIVSVWIIVRDVVVGMWHRIVMVLNRMRVVRVGIQICRIFCSLRLLVVTSHRRLFVPQMIRRLWQLVGYTGRIWEQG